MSAQTIDFSTCSASDAAQAIISLELGRGIAYAASVRRGENHVREMLKGINAAVSTSLLKADEIKALVGDILNGFKQQCHRLNLEFTVGSKKTTLYTSPREVKQAAPAVDASATPAVDASATPAVDASATPAVDASATPAVDASATPAVDASATPAVDASATIAELRAQVSQLQTERFQLRERCDSLRAERDELRAQLDALLASAPQVEPVPVKKAKRA